MSIYLLISVVAVLIPKVNCEVPSVEGSGSVGEVFTVSPDGTSVVIPPTYSDCGDVSDGFVHFGHCSKKFFLCQGGRRQDIMTCPSNLVFNGTTCTHPRNATECADIIHCIGAPPGMLSIGPCSNYFLMCVDANIGYRIKCPTGQVYDGTICRNSTDVAECGKTGSCVGASDGFVAAGACSENFLICQDEQLKGMMSCPSEMVFNGTICTFPAEVAKCPKPVVTTEDPFNTARKPHCQPLCEYSSNQVGIPTGLCSKQYVICSPRGVLVVAQCPEGSVFNASLSTCVSNEKCQNNPSFSSIALRNPEFCVGRENRMFRDPEFFDSLVQCHNGEIAKNNLCPHKLFFNENLQKCDDNRNERDCHGVPFLALFADEKDIIVFWHCFGYRMLSMECPPGYFWDSSRCACAVSQMQSAIRNT